MQTAGEDKENAGISSDNFVGAGVHSQKKSQCLLSTIQEHLAQQSKRLLQEEIFKQSVVKYSLDKDFAYLFEESGLKIKRQKPQTAIADTKRPPKVESVYQSTLLKWLETNQQRAVMHLPFSHYMDCFGLLNSKLESSKLVIVVTEHHLYFSEKLEQLNNTRKQPIKWASLFSALTIETKSKILEMYELGKLSLLLITPQLFQNQKYQQFKCDLLVIAGIHLYEQQSGLLVRIVQNTQPNRVLGCYEYLTEEHKKRLKWTDLGRLCQFESTVWLKGDHKCKNLLNYLSKREHSRVLVVVRDKRSADELSSSLSLEAYKVTSLLNLVPKHIFKSYSLPHLLTARKNNLEQQLCQALRRCLSSTIIISSFFEALRLIQYDLVVFYDQPSIKQYMQLQSLSSSRLGLLSDDDYYICRNLETSSIVDRSIFEKLVSNILDRRLPKQAERKAKRFYSDSLDEFGPVDPSTNIKSIAVNRYCSEYEISKPQLISILGLLRELNLLVVMESVKYQCLVQQRSAQQFKLIFPNHNLITRRINILNLASEYKTTTESILQAMKNNNIRFLVCEELIPVRLLQFGLESAVETAWICQQREVLKGIREIDLSYILFDQFTFPNTQFLRRDKLTAKRKEMIPVFQQYLKGELELSRLPLLRINSVNRKLIQQWVVEVMHDRLTIHDIVLFLQGTLNQRTSIHQDEPIFKSFYKYKYEDLAQLVEGITKNKKVRVN